MFPEYAKIFETRIAGEQSLRLLYFRVTGVVYASFYLASVHTFRMLNRDIYAQSHYYYYYLVFRAKNLLHSRVILVFVSRHSESLFAFRFSQLTENFHFSVLFFSFLFLVCLFRCFCTFLGSTERLDFCCFGFLAF